MFRLIFLIPGVIFSAPMFAQAAVLTYLLYQSSGLAALQTKFYRIYMICAVSTGFLNIFQAAFAATDEEKEVYSLLYTFFITITVITYSYYLYLRSYAASQSEKLRRLLKYMGFTAISLTAAQILTETLIALGVDGINGAHTYVLNALSVDLCLMEAIGLGIFLDLVFKRQQKSTDLTETDIVARYGSACTFVTVSLCLVYLLYGKIDTILYLVLTGICYNAILLLFFSMKLSIMRFKERNNPTNATSISQQNGKQSVQSRASQAISGTSNVYADQSSTDDYQTTGVVESVGRDSISEIDVEVGKRMEGSSDVLNIHIKLNFD